MKLKYFSFFFFLQYVDKNIIFPSHINLMIEMINVSLRSFIHLIIRFPIISNL